MKKNKVAFRPIERALRIEYVPYTLSEFKKKNFSSEDKIFILSFIGRYGIHHTRHFSPSTNQSNQSPIFLMERALIQGECMKLGIAPLDNPAKWDMKRASLEEKDFRKFRKVFRNMYEILEFCKVDVDEFHSALKTRVKFAAPFPVVRNTSSLSKIEKKKIVASFIRLNIILSMLKNKDFSQLNDRMNYSTNASVQQLLNHSTFVNAQFKTANSSWMQTEMKHNIAV